MSSKNPLASITAGLSLLEISSDEKNVSDAREIMQLRSNSFGKLVDDLLDLTRITKTRLQLKKETFQINDLILNIVDDMKWASGIKAFISG
jgi:signal transduction histidine kinase